MVETGPDSGWHDLKPPRKYENHCHFCKLTISTTEKNISWHPREYLLIHNVCKKLLKLLKPINEKILDSVLTGNSKETEGLRDEALSYLPPYALNLIIESLKEKKDYVSAIRVLEIVLERGGVNADTHIKLGKIYETIGDYEKSILHFKKAIKESEQQHSLDDVAYFYNAHMIMAETYGNIGKHDQSIKTLNKLLKDLVAREADKIAKIYFSKSRELIGKAKNADASGFIILLKRTLSSFRQCLDEDSENLMTLDENRNHYFYQQCIDEFEKKYKTDERSIPKDLSYLFNTDYKDEHNFDKQSSNTRKLMEIILSVPVITNLARIQAWGGVFLIFSVLVARLSTKEIQRLAKKFPEIEEQIKSMLEDYQTGKKVKNEDELYNYNWSMELWPATAHSRAFMLFVAMDGISRGATEDEVGLLSNAMLFNCSAEIMYCMIVKYIRSLLDKKYFDIAKQHVEHLDFICKNLNYNRYASEWFVTELSSRYEIFMHEKNFKAAIDCMKEVLDYHPSYYVPLRNIVNAYRKSKDFSSALEFSERLVKTAKNITDRRIHADILYNLKKYQEALIFYEDTILDIEKFWKKKEQREAIKETIYIKIGHCQLKLSESDKALDTFQNIVNQNKGNLDALDGLRQSHIQLGNDIEAAKIGKEIFKLKRRESNQLKSKKKPTVGKSPLDTKLDFLDEQKEQAAFDITQDLKFPREWSNKTLLDHLEDLIRQFLQDKLEHIEKWEEKYLRPSNYKEAKRRQKDPGVPGVTSKKPNQPLVYSMVVSDYIHIMENDKLWGKYFAKCFRNKAITLGNLETFNKIRQDNAHHLEIILDERARYEADKITYFFDVCIKSCKKS